MTHLTIYEAADDGAETEWGDQVPRRRVRGTGRAARPMSAWTPEELAAFGDADEIGIASLRPDGTAAPGVTIWFARLGDDLYVRSAYGPDNGWYRRARASREGTIQAGGRDARTSRSRMPIRPSWRRSTAAYHAKYDRYGERIVNTVISDEAAAATLRVVPR